MTDWLKTHWTKAATGVVLTCLYSLNQALGNPVPDAVVQVLLFAAASMWGVVVMTGHTAIKASLAAAHIKLDALAEPVGDKPDLDLFDPGA